MLFLLLISVPMFISIFWMVFFFIEYWHNPPAKRVIAWFFVAASGLYACHYQFFASGSKPLSEVVYTMFNLCVFPLFYIFINYLSLQKTRLIKQILHLSPMIFITIFLTVCYIYNIESLRNIVQFVARIMFAVQVVYVWICGTRNLRQFCLLLDNEYSDMRSYALHPMNVLLALFSIISVVAAILNIIGREWFATDNMVIIPAIMMSCLLYALGYIIHKIPNVSYNSSAHDEIFSEGKQQCDELPTNFQTELKKQLEQLLQTEKLWLEPKLTLTEMATRLGTNRSYLSQMINREYGMNFSQYINIYRLENAKSILKSKEYHNDKEAIYNAIYNSGFLTEQNFYRLFRSYTGKTPLEYRNNYN